MVSCVWCLVLVAAFCCDYSDNTFVRSRTPFVKIMLSTQFLASPPDVYSKVIHIFMAFPINSNVVNISDPCVSEFKYNLAGREIGEYN